MPAALREPSRSQRDAASELMLRFAARTGLDSERPPRRYLWTDAFAVCNLLGLARATGNERHHELALRLVEQVHHVLGRHRADDPRSGWLSGLDAEQGALHPTRGGLRIGKRLAERAAGERFDERLEWDRDGQYFHYLTRWMHALDQVARATGEARFNTWARELAETAHRAFTHDAPDGSRRMAWKLSIDLSRPLVPSMGQHDPLEGLVSCLQLRATASSLAGAPEEPRLDEAIEDFARMTAQANLASADPLGIGGLLIDAARLAQLGGVGPIEGAELLENVLDAAHAGLAHGAFEHGLRQPASQRLAFRELGLAIGLAALGVIDTACGDRARPRLDALARYARLGPAIASFWLAPAARAEASWREHQDIDDVMLASVLVPEGVLILGSAQGG